MGGRLRTLPIFSPCLVGAVLLLAEVSVASAQQSAPPSETQNISSARVASLVFACRNKAQRVASAKQLHSIRWDNAAQPEVLKRARAIAHILIAGQARHGNDWVSITAQCAFDNDRLSVVSLDWAPTPPLELHLNPSGSRPPLEVPAQPDTTSPASSLSSSQADSAEASGSSIAPTLQHIPSNVPPAIGKEQDFIHDHWFGFELQGRF